MPIPYDVFRSLTWSDRLGVFNVLSAEGKAELVRSQVGGWLDRHRDELTNAQVLLLEEAVQLIVPELYAVVKEPALMTRLNDVERRARELLTPQQAVEALTMQWGMT